MLDFRQWMESQFKEAVLVAIGAFNPVHRGHIKMFYDAKRYIETTEDTTVIRGFIVPRNETFVKEKMASKHEPPIPLHHRIAMIMEALKGTFIRLSTVDLEYGPKPDPEIKKYFQQKFPGSEIIMIQGEDHVQCPGGKYPCLLQKPHARVYVADRSSNISSTLIRQHLHDFGDEPKMVSPAVRNYLHNNPQLFARR